MEYLTIDFETANNNPTSACSIGLVLVNEGRIVLEDYYLINPEEQFNYSNVLVHKITSDMVLNAPTFDKVWENISMYFENSIVFAHNASFDIKVLKCMLEKYGIKVPNIKFGCTLKIAQKVFKEEVVNCKLETLSSYFGAEHNKHNALSDAHICYVIIEKAKTRLSLNNASELYDFLDFRYGILNEKVFVSSSDKHKENKKAPLNPLKNKIFYLSGKAKNYSLNELSHILSLLGAFVDNELTLATNYFVSLQNTPNKKMKEALDVIARGGKLEIIKESDLLEMIGDFNEEN